MDKFNFKEFLIENRVGMYAKARPITEEIEVNTEVTSVHEQPVEEGSSEVNTTTVDVRDHDMIILGKEYIINGTAEVEFTEEEADYEDHMMINPGGYVVEKATIAISDLAVEDGDSYRSINDPKYIKQIQDLINTDPKLQNRFEKFCAEYLVDWSSLGEQIGVGYVSKVKDADPAQEDFE